MWPAGVPGHLRRGGLDRRGVHRPGQHQLVVVAGVREVRIQHRDPAGDVPDPDGAADGHRRVERHRAAQRVVRRGQHRGSRRPVRHDRDHRGDRQRAVQVGEQHPAGIRRDAGLEPDVVGQPRRVHDQQHEVPAVGVQPLRGQVHLVGRGEVDEADRLQRRWPDGAVVECRPPLRGLDQVEEDLGSHSAILP
jgi:hypothetical protein